MLPLGFIGDILAEVLKVPPDSINEIISGKRDITVDMALRLARYFNTTPELWTGLQEDYDLRMAHSRHPPKADGARCTRPTPDPTPSARPRARGCWPGSLPPRAPVPKCPAAEAAYGL